MKRLVITLLAGFTCMIPLQAYAESDNKSGFGFGMGSGTPTRSGNNYGWGFGPAEDYDRRDNDIDRSSATGGWSWGNGRRDYRRERPFFRYGSRRNYYGPPPQYMGHPDWRNYPPPQHPYWQQHQQPATNNPQ
ncbi:MAG: hypothetical protein OQL16_03440 [Gammaproteobacteria bacterium]|nr:hypothetical protein [Gammaproteobacteria bacterium]